MHRRIGRLAHSSFASRHRRLTTPPSSSGASWLTPPHESLTPQPAGLHAGAGFWGIAYAYCSGAILRLFFCTR